MTFQNFNRQPFRFQFLESPIHQEGQKCPPEYLHDRLASIEQFVNRHFETPQTCFVRDDNPLDLALFFFTLIDFGHCPILLDAELSDYQIEAMRDCSQFPLIDQKTLKRASNGTQPPAYPHCFAALTSGTTSCPKLCYLSIDGAIMNARAHAQSLGIASRHTVIQSLPLNHSFGIIAYLWTKIVTGCAIGFNQHFLGLKTLVTKSFKDGILHLSPAQLQFMLKEPESGLNGIDVISVGGGLADPSDIRQLQAKFIGAKIYITYGLTEAGPRVSTGEVTQDEPKGYIGRPLNNIRIAVLREDGQIAPAGEGSLCVSSPSLKVNLEFEEMARYQGQPFLITRDIVRVQDNTIIFKSRASDLIKVGGISVYPQDIETIVKQMKDVNDCIVFPMKHRIYGNVPLLIIEGEGEAQDINAYIKDKLTVYQRPKKILFTHAFPRHSLDKVDRKKLWEMIG